MDTIVNNVTYCGTMSRLGIVIQSPNFVSGIYLLYGPCPKHYAHFYLLN